MSHNIGNNKYDVIYDECQDGFFDSGDAIFPQAFEVTLDPAQTPQDTVNFSNQLHIFKDHADKLAKSYHRYRTVVTDADWISLMVGVPLAYHELKPIFDTCKLTPGFTAACLQLTGLIALKMIAYPLEKKVLDGFEQSLQEHATHWEQIAADPPDANYKHSTTLSSREILDPHNDDTLQATKVQLANDVNTEGSILSSLLSTLQRYQGAASANDIQWL